MDTSIFSAYQIQITAICDSDKESSSDSNNYTAKSKIELLCADEDKSEIISTIQKTANTGKKDDGLVFSYKIDRFGKICNIGIDIIGF
ncbi:P-II family nitrogen regulator [Nitrosopumilus sp. K4]|uniref:P-II family nitrogen regulator n=1 Tax=Nitrosopumilus sp. K4 TaxID=2795383 RepID=UPI002012AC59|nr:P-II family nitrogen regulator [Nitrosopumilus sp. K4]